MKAVQFSTFGNPDVLQIVDIAMPHVGPRQVRIQVRVAGINASDWKKRQGLLDPILPQTLGYEAAGIVDEVGEDVTNIKLGDRIFGFCTNSAAQAEYAVLTHYSHMPVTLDFLALRLCQLLSKQRHECLTSSMWLMVPACW